MRSEWSWVVLKSQNLVLWLGVVGESHQPHGSDFQITKK